MTTTTAAEKNPRLYHDDTSTNERFTMEDGQFDGLLTFVLDGNIEFVAEFNGSYQVKRNEDQAQPDSISYIEIGDDIDYSEFKQRVEGSEEKTYLDDVMIEDEDQEVIKEAISGALERWFKTEEDIRLNKMETDIVAYDVFFECLCPEIKVFSEVRIGADSIPFSTNPSLAIILYALDNEGVTDEKSAKKQLMAGAGEDGSEGYEDITVWNDEKTMGYSVSRVVPLKEVNVSVKYNGEMRAKKVLVPLHENENTFGRYYN